jgi:DNA-directed RNA polymerase subunit alpha
MRITWRGLELPTRILRDEQVSSDRYGRFMIEPFERGFGTTIGNGLKLPAWTTSLQQSKV